MDHVLPIQVSANGRYFVDHEGQHIGRTWPAATTATALLLIQPG